MCDNAIPHKQEGWRADYQLLVILLFWSGSQAWTPPASQAKNVKIVGTPQLFQQLMKSVRVFEGLFAAQAVAHALSSLCSVDMVQRQMFFEIGVKCKRRFLSACL